MKLPYQQLETHLSKKSLAPLYLISGDEPLLAQDALDLLHTAAALAGFSERTRLSVESGNEWGKEFYAIAHCLSLFAEKRIIELDLRSAKFNQTTSKIVQDYAQKPSRDTLVLIITNKLDQKTEQTNWFKSIEKNSVFMPIWPIAAEQLPQWILMRAKKMGLTLSPKAASWLAEHIEGNLLAAAQELEKLKLLELTDVIDESLLESIGTDLAHFDIFNLVDSFLAGNHERSIRILRNLAAEDTEPTLVLWALSRELRTMADILQAQQKGAALSALFSQFRIWDKRQASVRAFLKRNTLLRCWELLTQAADIDPILKGAASGNAWDEFERLVTTTK